MRKTNLAIIGDNEHECLKAEFEEDWAHYLKININQSLLKRAEEFVEVIALRSDYLNPN